MRTALLLAVMVLGAAANAADFDVRNAEEFKKIIPDGAKVEKLATGFKFVEGPTWVNWEGGFLIFSDIPANHLKKWTAKDGVTVWRQASNGANGNTPDLQDRLITCEHTSRRVTMTEPDGKLTVVAEKSADGKRFNSPNDVAMKSDGTIYFTDPPYGLPQGQAKEQGGNYVFRFDPQTKEAKAIVTSGLDMPNGIAFSPDEKKLYVADSGTPRLIRVYEVKEDGAVGEGAVFCKIDKGGPDGIRVDADGRVWSSAGDGVQVFAPDGSLVGKILVPESPANLCFGGEDGRTLFITARTSLFSIKTNVKGTSR